MSNEKKVVLILVDGMRGDAVENCGSEYARELVKNSTYTLKARTVMPSVTLPCHMSLFHSVDPERHGIVTNQYIPQVRPIEGLVERLDAAEQRCAFFITWEELRDLTRPDHLAWEQLINLHKNRPADAAITDAAIEYLKKAEPDFTFLYLGDTDEMGGHDCGWMSETYMKVVANAFECIRRVREALPEDLYDVIVVADHGGHDRHHGCDCAEDMTIPVIANGPSFAKNTELENISIKDLAPTIAEILGAKPAREWEGKSFLKVK